MENCVHSSLQFLLQLLKQLHHVFVGNVVQLLSSREDTLGQLLLSFVVGDLLLSNEDIYHNL